MHAAAEPIPGTRESTAGGVFINYRSSPERALTLSLLQARLVQHFGPDRVFRDEQMAPGVRYPDELRERLHDCGVLLVVVHKGWLSDADGSGQRLIDRGRDWVREEIEFALGAGKHVFQVLLGDAARPEAGDLPASIRELALRQDFRLTAEEDVDRLLRALERHVAPTWQPGPPPTPVRQPRSHSAMLALASLYPPVFTIGLWRTDGLRGVLTGLVLLGMVAAALHVIGWAVTYLGRRPIHAWERQPTLDRPFLRRLLSPPVVTLFFILLVLTWVSAQGSHWPVLTFLTAATVIAYLSTLMVLRERDRERQEEEVWPLTSCPADPTAQSVHNDLGRLRKRLETWRRPLSRQQRDEAQWALARLDDTAGELSRRAGRTRRSWLTAREQRTAGDAILAGWGVLGLVALPGLWVAALSHSGHLVRTATLLLLGTCAFVAMVFGGLELRYRRERWKAGTLAAEIGAEVVELRELLDRR